MSGYTPVFDTVFHGTLCGKWPDLPVWLSLLPLADWQGHIDMTPQAIAAVTGWPLELLAKGIEALTRPDPDSRSPDEDGRRLMPLDPNRKWGWRVVNIQKYRRLASGQIQSASQVADGRNAEKVRRYKERHRQTPADTADTSGHQNSDSYTNSDKSKRGRAKRASRVPEDFSPDLDFARSQCPGIDAAREAQKFRDWEFKTPRSDWSACWRNWIERCRDKGEYARLPNNGLGSEFAGYKFT